MEKIYEGARKTSAGYRETSPDRVFEAGRAARIVDVRQPDEYVGELGHIDGAELVPLATLGNAAVDWDKSATIVVVCRSGGRSAAGAQQLVKLGFTRVINMAGGMLEWNARRLPVTRMREAV